MSDPKHTDLDPRELARRLNAALGPTLVAALAGTKGRAVPLGWETPDGAAPQPEQARRLTVGYEIWSQIAAAESDDVARAWFIGANPRLAETTVLTAIREDRFDQVRAAAQAMVDGGFSG